MGRSAESLVSLLFARMVLVPAVIVCACTDAIEPPDTVRMYRARSVHDAPGSKERVRQELGCDPCESFFDENEDGDLIEFLYNDEAPMTLAGTDIESVSIGKVSNMDSPYLLVLRVSESGVERIAKYRGSAETVLTVNEIDGEIVGITPLWVSGRAFTVGYFDTLDQAKSIAAKLGVPVEVLIEPTI